jgi:integrase
LAGKSQRRSAQPSCTPRAPGQTAIPASAAAIWAFAVWAVKSRSPATLKRYLSSIAAIHRHAGLENPVPPKARLLAMQASERRQKRSNQPWLFENCLEQIAKCKTGDISASRNRALLRIGIATGMTAAQLVSINWSDLQISPEWNGIKLTIDLRDGESPKIFLLEPEVCQAVLSWAAFSYPCTGPVFCRLHRRVMNGTIWKKAFTAVCYAYLSRPFRLCAKTRWVLLAVRRSAYNKGIPDCGFGYENVTRMAETWRDERI